MRTITGLINATSYTVKVAAVNSEGMGPFTDTLVAKTVQGELVRSLWQPSIIIVHTLYNNFCHLYYTIDIIILIMPY